MAKRNRKSEEVEQPGTDQQSDRNEPEDLTPVDFAEALEAIASVRAAELAELLPREAVDTAVRDLDALQRAMKAATDRHREAVNRYEAHLLGNSERQAHQHRERVIAENARARKIFS